MSYSGPFPFPVAAGGTAQSSSPLTVAHGGTNHTSAVSFSAYLNTSLTNVTGDGTGVGPVIFDTTLTNIGTAYSTSTGIFTAPIAGNYLFSASLSYFGIGAGHNSAYIFFTATLNSVATQWQAWHASPAANVSGVELFQGTASVVVPMLVNDVIHIGTLVSGSTKTVSLLGATGSLTSLSSFFSGCLLV